LPRASASSLEPVHVSLAYPSRPDVRIPDVPYFFAAVHDCVRLPRNTTTPTLPLKFRRIDEYRHGGRKELSAGEDPAESPPLAQTLTPRQPRVAQAMDPCTRLAPSSSPPMRQHGSPTATLNGCSNRAHSRDGLATFHLVSRRGDPASPYTST
jgi:hypothetical protein